jgi:hypothetical protein
MKHGLTGLVCAIALGVVGQGAVAQVTTPNPASQTTPADRVFSPAFERHPNVAYPSSAFYQRRLIENFYRNTPSAARAYQAHLNVAQCVVDRSGSKAGRLLGGPGTDDRRYRRLSNAMFRQYNNCASLNSLEQLSPSVLNAALAERLVLDEGESAALAPVATPRAAITEGAADGGFVALAQCVVSQAPGDARAVLQTSAGSPAERTALAVLYSNSSVCEAASLPSETPVLVQRARIAEQLYSLTHLED